MGATTPADTQFALNWLDASEAQILTDTTTVVAASDLPPPARRRAFAQETQTRTARPKSVVTIFSSVLLPVYDTLDTHATRRQANEAVTLAASDVLGAWTKDGTFPTALPHPIADPFTGRALGYRREGDDGFVVYSVGVDGTFDGGKPGDKTPPGQTLYRYPAVAVPVPANMLK